MRSGCFLCFRLLNPKVGKFDYKIVLIKETRKSSPIARRLPPPLKVSRLWIGSEMNFTSKSDLVLNPVNVLPASRA